MAGKALSSEELENRRKAFDFVDSWSKLLSTLSTGTLVLSATFIKDVLPKDTQIEARELLFAAWATLGVSALLGPFVLGALISHLSRPATQELDAYAGSIRLFSFLQLATFVLGEIFFTVFVGNNL